jgi:hypothetical protein
VGLDSTSSEIIQWRAPDDMVMNVPNSVTSGEVIGQLCNYQLLQNNSVSLNCRNVVY